MALTKVPSNLDATVAITQSASDNSTNIATTAYVTTALANLVDSAPGTLNTLNELAAALGDDASFSTTITNSIATKAPLASPAFTGDVTIGVNTAADGAHFQHYQSAARHQSFQSTAGDLAILTDNNTNPAVFIKGTGTADLVNVFDNTTEVFTILDGGNVGIGDSSPNTALQIVGLNQTNGTLELTPNAAKGSFASYVHYGTNGDWYIRSANASGNVNIQDTGGNVGIGTSSPNSYSGQTALTINSTSVSRLDLDIGNTMQGYLLSESGYIALYAAAGNSVSLGVSGVTTSIKIDSSGDVGIGTPSPTKKLTVFGTGAGNATVQIEGESGADPYINFLANNTTHWSAGIDDSDADKFKISKHSALGTNDYFTLATNGAATFNSFVYLDYIRGKSDSNTGVNVAGSDVLELQTGGDVRVKVQSGKVSIGTTAVSSATSAPLHVAQANTDIQAIFGDNNAAIDDPTIRVLGRNSANTSARFSYLGLDADGNYGFIGYNAGSGTPVQALSILTDGKVGIGTDSPTEALEVAGNVKLTGSSRLLLPNFWIGPVPNTANNNNGAVLLVNLSTINASNVGFQFSGSIIGNSYTGQAYVNVNIVKHYNNDNVAFDASGDSNLTSTVSRMQLNLCTVTYSGNSYLAIVKNGGGTGTIFLNGYFQGWYPSQVTEVASGTYTITTNHGNLNF